MKYIKHVIIFSFLTLFTQVGGVIYLIYLFIQSKIQFKTRLFKLLSFLSVYLFFTFLIIPFIAFFLGRKALPLYDDFIQPANTYTVLMNRHYVSEELYDGLLEVKEDLKEGGLFLTYLDANHPFVDGYPLLPHLSHNDGDKLDLAFIYKEEKFYSPSFSGYGVYYQKENVTCISCKSQGYSQYDFTKYLGWKLRRENSVDINKTRKLLEILTNNKKVRKIFLEPYLKSMMNLSSDKIRFHGCKTVRHDDHIHIQL